MARPRIIVLAASAVALLLAGCGAAPEPGAIRVGAASSLTEALTAMAADYTGGDVSLTFGASSSLVEQVHQGAPIDVVAVADHATLTRLVEGGDTATGPVVVARNRLTVVVPRGNPKQIGGLADLGRAGLLVALCAPEVPCGRLATEALRRAGTEVVPTSTEDNVKAVVARIALGQADAGVAYVTDVRAEDKVEGVALGIPEDASLEAVYSMVVTRQARDRDAGRAFVAFVGSAAGRRELARFGFLAP
ncbi:MAG TPA: molybdate ABC transporter substrate-binding protein [Acidimicrobiales bacterium]|nr:molybdate ABC transporter substrate-binding protein [Acidimicrobiales bacterium]